MEKVVIKRVGKEIEIAEVEKITLSYMQEVVGGLIEIPYLSEALSLRGIDIVLNEEGKLNQMDPNLLLLNDEMAVLDIIVGDILFTSHDDDGETIGLNDNQIHDIEKLFKCNKVKTNNGDLNYIIYGDDLTWI